MRGLRGAGSLSRPPPRRTAFSHVWVGLPGHHVYSDSSPRRAPSAGHCSRRGSGCQAGSPRPARPGLWEACSCGTRLLRRETRRRRHGEERRLLATGRRRLETGSARRRRRGHGRRARWFRGPGPRRRPPTEHRRTASDSLSCPSCGPSGPGRHATRGRPCQHAWTRLKGPEHLGLPGSRRRPGGCFPLGPVRPAHLQPIGHSLARSPRLRAQRPLLGTRPRRRGRGLPCPRRLRLRSRLRPSVPCKARWTAAPPRLLRRLRLLRRRAASGTASAGRPRRRRSTQRTLQRFPTASTAPPGPSASSREATGPRRRARAAAAKRRSGRPAAGCWRASRPRSSRRTSCPSPTTCRRRPRPFTPRAPPASREMGAMRRTRRSSALPKRTSRSEPRSATRTLGSCASKRRSAASRRRRWWRTSSPDSGRSARAPKQPRPSFEKPARLWLVCGPQKGARKSSRRRTRGSAAPYAPCRMAALRCLLVRPAMQLRLAQAQRAPPTAQLVSKLASLCRIARPTLRLLETTWPSCSASCGNCETQALAAAEKKATRCFRVAWAGCPC